MAKYGHGLRASDLSLVDMADPEADSRAAVSVPPGVTENAAAIPAIDRFLAEAERELETGQLDQPLWAHAVVQAGGDEKLARPAYLKARATALRLEMRNRRALRVARRERAISSANGSLAGGSGRGATEKYGFTGLTRTQLAWLTGILSFLLVAAALIAFRTGGQPQQLVAASAARPAAQPKPGAAAAGTGPGATGAIAREDFEARVQELKEAGNWNVLVLYAAEWTRNHPTNAQAWKELSVGYSRMRQFSDALEAATKAVEMAPRDAALWRNLGQVNLALNDQPAALSAFEKAVELDTQDVPSLVQVGVLHLQLGGLPNARSALNKALAISPGDTDALCALSSVAQREGRAKEAEALASQVNSSGGRCRDLTPGESTTVSAAKAAKPKPGSTSQR
ncbi:MAG TPA: tetratricopeptide repeat protein [Casimicrobiaceae bacterium]|nr:tetratricopeptide repeat protein [Casimicrobiaceae bacterium]